MPQDVDFVVEFSKFNEGLSPVAHLDPKTFVGDVGHAREMKSDIVSIPGFISQSPGLATLTNGDENGAVDQLIRFILDKPTAENVTFGLGTTKMFKITPSTVVNSGWPRTITGMTEGESLVRLKDNLFIFYNKTTGGDISVLPLTNLNQIRTPDVAANDSSIGTDAWTAATTLSTAIAALDGDYCYVTPTVTTETQYLKVTDFDFAIPSDATIVGISVQISKYSDSDGGDITDSKVRIVKGGTIGTTDKAKTDNWSTTQAYSSYGGQTDLWGETWTYSDINSTGFGVAISAIADAVGPTAYIDHVKIAVYYTSGEDGEIYEAWGSISDQELENAPHPSAAKEDIMTFGNGRYLGVYIQGDGTLDTQKLDFGSGAEVADVVFHANVWWIAVNSGEGKRSQIYMYDGSALSNVLSDETGVGDQKIGFLYVLNGVVYVCYDDLSLPGYSIGYISGRAIKPLRYFTGSLPDHRQKALYKNNIMFVSDNDVMLSGATVEQLPIQISKISSGGLANIGGIASPFGVPMIASYESTSYQIDKFSGLSVDSNWKSIFNDISKYGMLGRVHTIVVYTKKMETDARADLKLVGNQGEVESSEFEISLSKGETRVKITNIDLIATDDIGIEIDFANGHITNGCYIRKVVCLGNYVER